MPEEKQLIQPLQVVRDEYGFWTHPAWPDDGDECTMPFSWFGDHGLEYCVVEMENDGPEELNNGMARRRRRLRLQALAAKQTGR
ncbi:hypothetical protein [Pseudomonas rustica]